MAFIFLLFYRSFAIGINVSNATPRGNQDSFSREKLIMTTDTVVVAAASVNQGVGQPVTTWEGAVSGFMVAYTDVLKTSPEWVHLSIAGMVVLCFMTYFTYKYLMHRLDTTPGTTATNNTMSLELLIQVMTEHAHQANSSAQAVEALTSRVDDVSKQIKDLTEVSKSFAESIAAFSTMLESFSVTIKEVKDIVAASQTKPKTQSIDPLDWSPTGQ